MIGQSLRRAGRRRRQPGQALVEYTFLLVLFFAVAIAIFLVVGNEVKNTFSNIEDAIHRVI